jgi:hypothetical protein
MAEFLTTAAVILQVENIIKNATKKLVLISPFVQINKILLERLQQASEREVEIILIYGKGELKRTEKKQIESIENLTLYYYENLHAKCYFNEKEMVITSMNLYEFSEKNNREMGIYIRKENDEDIFKDTVDETHSIIKASKPVVKKESKIVEIKKTYTKPISSNGLCIRCSDKIQYNINSPYCKECYSSWSYYMNNSFTEKYCHGCGTKEQTSMDKPLCHDCFIEYVKK